MKHNHNAARLSALAQAQINLKVKKPGISALASLTTLQNQVINLSEARQWAVAAILLDAVDLVNTTVHRRPETANLQDDYQDFFQAALKKYNVDSPAELNTDEKTASFFNYIRDNWKNGVGPKSEASVETADYQDFYQGVLNKFGVASVNDLRNPNKLEEFFSYIRDNYKPMAVATVSSSGNFADFYNSALEKFGVLTPLELYHPENISKFFGYIRDNWKGSTEVTATVEEEPSQVIMIDASAWTEEEFAEVASLIEEQGDMTLAEIRRMYGSGTAWNDTSVYDGDIPSVTVQGLRHPANVTHPLAESQPGTPVNINGMDCEVQAVTEEYAAFSDGETTVTLPLANIVMASPTEGTVVEVAMLSDRLLTVAGFDDLSKYKALRQDVAMATANANEMAETNVGKALRALANAEDRHSLVLAHAGLQRVNEGYSLLRAGLHNSYPIETAEIVELSDLNNLCGMDQLSAQDVLDAAPNVTHLYPGEHRSDLDAPGPVTDVDLNDSDEFGPDAMA